MDFIRFTLGEGRVHSQEQKHAKCKFMEYLMIKPYLHYKVSNAVFKGLHGTDMYILQQPTWASSAGNFFVQTVFVWPTCNFFSENNPNK